MAKVASQELPDPENSSEPLRRAPMTPILLLLAFLLVLDVLVLLGHSHDSRDGQDWKPRGSPSLGPSAVAPI
jgi:hypothetical protein